jgi:hypothetical protein
VNDPGIQATFDYLFDLAQQALAQGRSFAPFATASWDDGARTHSTADLPTGASTPQEHIAALIPVLQQEAVRGAAAVGVAFDAKMAAEQGAPVDAVGLHLEVAAQAVEVFVPYARDSHGAAAFQPPIVVDVTPRIYKP